MKASHIVLLIVWVVAVMVTLLWLNSARIKPFDPDLQLMTSATNVYFDDQVSQLIPLTDSEDRGRVVHITNQKCICDQFAQRHARALAADLQQYGFRSSAIELDEFEIDSAVVPSTPAVAVFDRHNRLRYLGPYAAGLGCLTNNTFIEQISNIARTDAYIGAVINHEVSGCFCANPQPRFKT